MRHHFARVYNSIKLTAAAIDYEIDAKQKAGLKEPALYLKDH